MFAPPRLLLIRYSFDQDIVLTLSRDELIENYTQLLSRGVDPSVAARKVDPELEKQRMAHEKEMKQLELKLEKEKMAFLNEIH